MDTRFLDQLSQQLLEGKSPACRRAIGWLLNQLRKVTRTIPRIDCSILMTTEVVKEAWRSNLEPPFRIRLVDANGTLIRQSEIHADPPKSDDCALFETYEDCYAGGTTSAFPLTSKLSDAESKSCEYVMSNKLMGRVLERARIDENGVSHFNFSV
jgi:hypothetical protein